MHIVLDARFLRRSTGGIGRYTRSLITELAALPLKDRFTVLMTLADREDWKILARAHRLVAPVWQAHAVDIPHYSWREQTELPRVLASLKPDLVHFTNFNHPISWNQPFVVTIHDLTILKFPAGRRQQSPLFQWGFRQVLRHACQSAARIITDSESSKNDLIEVLGTKPKKIAVVYLGIEASYQPINLPQRGRTYIYLNKTYQIKPPYLLFVSQWRPHKGIEVLLAAYAQFRADHPRLTHKLVLVGQPHPAYPEIPAAIKNHPYASDIITPGFVAEEDLPKLYQGAELFICPSLYEGFGLPPLEAMACGTPVIASRSSSLPEVVGDAAVLVAPSDPNALAKALSETLLNHHRLQQLHAAGLKQARRFSWSRMAQETLAIYHGLNVALD